MTIIDRSNADKVARSDDLVNKMKFGNFGKNKYGWLQTVLCLRILRNMLLIGICYMLPHTIKTINHP
jgi:hypothetical protein